MEAARPHHLPRTHLGWALILVPLLGSPSSAWASLRMVSAWSTNPCAPGRPVALTLTIRWTGDAAGYRIRPPELDLPKGLTKESVSSRSYHEASDNVVSYSWLLRATTEGLIEPFPIRVSVLRQGDEKPSVLEIKTESLDVRSSHWTAVASRLYLVAGVWVLAGIAGAIWILRKRRIRRRPPPESPQTPDNGQVSQLLEELRQSQIRGDTLSFLEGALRIQHLLSNEDHPGQDPLRSLLDQARYGGRTLSHREMEEWIHRLETRAARARDQDDKVGG